MFLHRQHEKDRTLAFSPTIVSPQVFNFLKRHLSLSAFSDNPIKDKISVTVNMWVGRQLNG